MHVVGKYNAKMGSRFSLAFAASLRTNEHFRGRGLHTKQAALSMAWQEIDAGAASRPIAGKLGSHKYSAVLVDGDHPVGAGLPAMEPTLTASYQPIAAGDQSLLQMNTACPSS